MFSSKKDRVRTWVQIEIHSSFKAVRNTLIGAISPNKGWRGVFLTCSNIEAVSGGVWRQPTPMCKTSLHITFGFLRFYGWNRSSEKIEAAVRLLLTFNTDTFGVGWRTRWDNENEVTKTPKDEKTNIVTRY